MGRKCNHGSAMMAYVASESAAQAHMTMLQGIVQRMAANSASCKTWCITIVSAVVVAVADKGNANLLWFAALPIPAFFMLDVYYLGLERGFRESYNKFVNRLVRNELEPSDLYCLNPSNDIVWLRLESVRSYSVLGYYPPLALLVALVGYAIN